MQGEQLAADKIAATSFVQDVFNFIKREGYTQQQSTMLMKVALIGKHCQQRP